MPEAKRWNVREASDMRTILTNWSKAYRSYATLMPFGPFRWVLNFLAIVGTYRLITYSLLGELYPLWPPPIFPFDRTSRMGMLPGFTGVEWFVTGLLVAAGLVYMAFKLRQFELLVGGILLYVLTAFLPWG